MDIVHPPSPWPTELLEPNKWSRTSGAEPDKLLVVSTTAKNLVSATIF